MRTWCHTTPRSKAPRSLAEPLGPVPPCRFAIFLVYSRGCSSTTNKDILFLVPRRKMQIQDKLLEKLMMNLQIQFDEDLIFHRIHPSGDEDADAVVPMTATKYSIDALKLPTIASWYPWYDYKKVGGWNQVYKYLTFMTVIGAGHEVPLHRPRLSLILFRHFLKNNPCLRRPELG